MRILLSFLTIAFLPHVISAQEKLLTNSLGMKLTRIEHRLALPDEVDSAGRKLNDPESYVELSETTDRGGSR